MTARMIVNRSLRVLQPVWPERRGLRVPAVHAVSQHGSNGKNGHGNDHGFNGEGHPAARRAGVFEEVRLEKAGNVV